MSFKEFMDKYLGIIIGVLVAVILILLNLVYPIECIVLIIAFGWFGKYVQNNKSSVKEKLKNTSDINEKLKINDEIAKLKKKDV